MKRMIYFIKSLAMNYKSWIAIYMFTYLIYPKNTFVTIWVMYLYFYIFHYVSHCDVFYPFNCIHSYHHSVSNILSDVSEIALEFHSFTMFMVIKLIADIYFDYKININNYHILFFTFSYIFVHAINYSMFHVNHVHEYHHENTQKNLGPDFLDILFETKHDPEHSLEDTTHYVYAIVLSFCLTSMIKCVESTISDKICLTNVLLISYFALTIIMYILTSYLFLNDIHYSLEERMRTFIFF